MIVLELAHYWRMDPVAYHQHCLLDPVLQLLLMEAVPLLEPLVPLVLLPLLWLMAPLQLLQPALMAGLHPSLPVRVLESVLVAQALELA